ncbi:MAG: hypothetical protein K8W52_17870 [Deltaproteobacteria bacterium]|nr:hypothetical protein [Deltaproteobacteria bacterium]
MSSLGVEECDLRQRLIDVLRESNGNVIAAARAMSRAPIQVRRWCRRFGVDVSGFRPSRHVTG